MIWNCFHDIGEGRQTFAIEYLFRWWDFYSHPRSLSRLFLFSFFIYRNEFHFLYLPRLSFLPSTFSPSSLSFPRPFLFCKFLRFFSLSLPFLLCQRLHSLTMYASTLSSSRGAVRKLALLLALEVSARLSPFLGFRVSFSPCFSISFSLFSF